MHVHEFITRDPNPVIIPPIADNSPNTKTRRVESAEQRRLDKSMSLHRLPDIPVQDRRPTQRTPAKRLCISAVPMPCTAAPGRNEPPLDPRKHSVCTPNCVSESPALNFEDNLSHSSNQHKTFAARNSFEQFEPFDQLSTATPMASPGGNLPAVGLVVVHARNHAEEPNPVTLRHRPPN